MIRYNLMAIDHTSSLGNIKDEPFILKSFEDESELEQFEAKAQRFLLKQRELEVEWLNTSYPEASESTVPFAHAKAYFELQNNIERAKSEYDMPPYVDFKEVWIEIDRGENV